MKTTTVPAALTRLRRLFIWMLLATLLGSGPAVQAASFLIPVPGVVKEAVTVRYENRNRRVVFLRRVQPLAGNPLVPAIVALHYAGGDGEQMANLTAIGKIVSETGAVAILPEALGRVWTSNPEFDRRRPDDLGFLTRVIDDALANPGNRIDPARVYMVGFSAGAYMTLRYVCQGSDRIAAAAYVSATLVDTLAAVCTSAVRVPMIGMHGTSDLLVPYDSSFGVRTAEETQAYFATRNQCQSPIRVSMPNPARDGTHIDRITYGSCATALPVQFYSIVGGGHAWPGTTFQLGGPGFRITRDIDGTRVIWDFLRQYSR